MRSGAEKRSYAGVASVGKRVAELYLDPYTGHFLITCLQRATSRQKNMLLTSMFARIDLDERGEICAVHPRKWAHEAFGALLRGWHGAYGYQPPGERLLSPHLVTPIDATAAAHWLFSRVKLHTEEKQK